MRAIYMFIHKYNNDAIFFNSKAMTVLHSQLWLACFQKENGDGWVEDKDCEVNK